MAATDQQQAADDAAWSNGTVIALILAGAVVVVVLMLVAYNAALRGRTVEDEAFDFAANSLRSSYGLTNEHGERRWDGSAFNCRVAGQVPINCSAPEGCGSEGETFVVRLRETPRDSGNFEVIESGYLMP